MWSYYGSKSKLLKYYPEPTKDKIIEPFAGSAKYSLKYFERDVCLYDKYEPIVKMWEYLINATAKDIDGLPKLKYGECIDDYSFDCIGQRFLMGYLVTSGAATPRKTMTKRAERDFNGSIDTIKKNIHKVKHWKVYKKDYVNIKNEDATWFIDPPYQHGGKHYKCSNKDIDFSLLHKWSKERIGEVIVCENTKADWIDLKPIKVLQGSRNTFTTEAVFLKGWDKNNCI